MIIFEGKGAAAWVYRVERYFALNELNEPEKLQAASLSLESKTLAWFQWCECRQPIGIGIWQEFRE